jgi:thioredoxin 1
MVPVGQVSTGSEITATRNVIIARVATCTGEGEIMTAHRPVPAVTEQTFDQEVLGAALPVLVDFTAPWCPPCRALEPIVHAVAAENAGRIEVRTVDGDEQTALAARWRVKAFPTVIAFAGGREVARHVGLTTKEKLLKLVTPAG